MVGSLERVVVVDWGDGKKNCCHHVYMPSTNTGKTIGQTTVVTSLSLRVGEGW